MLSVGAVPGPMYVIFRLPFTPVETMNILGPKAVVALSASATAPGDTERRMLAVVWPPPEITKLPGLKLSSTSVLGNGFTVVASGCSIRADAATGLVELDVMISV